METHCTCITYRMLFSTPTTSHYIDGATTWDFTLDRYRYNQLSYQEILPLLDPHKSCTTSRSLDMVMKKAAEIAIFDGIYTLNCPSNTELHKLHTVHIGKRGRSTIFPPSYWSHNVKVKEGSLGERCNRTRAFCHHTAWHWVPANIHFTIGRNPMQILSQVVVHPPRSHGQPWFGCSWDSDRGKGNGLV